MGIFTSYFLSYIKDDTASIRIKHTMHQQSINDDNNFLIDGVPEFLDDESGVVFAPTESFEENAVEVFFSDV